MKNNLEKETRWLLKEKYSGKATKPFYKDVERLKAGEPVAYVIGFSQFLGCKVDLSKRPLIPRVETEFWVNEAIRDVREEINTRRQATRDKRQVRVLDIFAGSGCIGISIIRHIPNSTIVFADSNKNATLQIKINCKVNNVDEKRYQVIQSDIFSKVSGRYDYIFANPPYIPAGKKKTLQSSVLDYEPHGALFGGVEGLLYIRKFLAEAKGFLNPEGKIYMEFDSPQKKNIDQLLKKLNYKSWQFHKDQYGAWRWVVVM